MIEIKRITSSHPLYASGESLMLSAFPIEERRNTDEQKYYTDHKENFYYNIITDKEKFIGIITYWDMQSFYYIEHFAIDKNLRGKGYGQQVLNKLKNLLKGPIVLEVEEPIEEISIQRISFYRKLGFTLHEKPYLQPPYRKGDPWFPLKLMTYGEIDMQVMYEGIKERIYKEVYNQP